MLFEFSGSTTVSVDTELNFLFKILCRNSAVRIFSFFFWKFIEFIRIFAFFVLPNFKDQSRTWKLVSVVYNIGPTSQIRYKNICFVFTHITSVVKPVHILMVRSRVFKSRLKVGLCYVHFACVPTHVLGVSVRLYIYICIYIYIYIYVYIYYIYI